MKYLLPILFLITLGAGCQTDAYEPRKTVAIDQNTPEDALKYTNSCPDQITTEVSIPEEGRICVFVKKEIFYKMFDECMVNSIAMPSEPYNFRCFSSKGMSEEQIITKASSTAFEIKADQKKSIDKQKDINAMEKRIEDAISL